MAVPTTEKSSAVGPLVRALWLPAFFVVGFMVFYMLPFHAASPNHMPVAVVGQQAASGLDAALERSMPGGLDVVAAYDPTTATTYIAGAEGQQVSQIVQRVFGPVAGQSGRPLQVVDVAPTASGDLLGNSLFYVAMAWNIGGYIVVMMMMQAVELTTRTKLLTLVGFGAAATVVAWVFGVSVGAISANPAGLVIGFLLNQAVAWTTFGMAPLVRRALPGVAMGLFVLLSIPSSDGALSRWMMPTVFQWLHYLMPLGNAVDGSRAVMYFGGTGWLRPALVLLAWVALGVGLVVFTQRRAAAAAGATDDDAEPAESAELAEERAEDGASVGGATDPAVTREPARSGTLSGRVRHVDEEPASGAVVTVIAASGRQVGRTAVDRSGGFRLEVPRGALTVVVQEPGSRPISERVTLASEVHREFRLVGDRQRAGAPAAAGAGAASSA